MTVFMKNCATAFAQNLSEFRDHQSRVGNETEDPATPAEIEWPGGEIIVHQIELVNIDIRERVLLNRADKIMRTLDRDDASAPADDFRKIDSRIARPGANVENAATGFDAGIGPTLQNNRLPGAMLNAESLQFLLMRSKNVIAFAIH